MALPQFEQNLELDAALMQAASAPDMEAFKAIAKANDLDSEQTALRGLWLVLTQPPEYVEAVRVRAAELGKTLETVQ